MVSENRLCKKIIAKTNPANDPIITHKRNLFNGAEMPKRKTPELLDNDYEIPPFLRNQD